MVNNLDDTTDEVADEPLTTKEGWRRFVDRQMTAPDLHNPATVELLEPADRDTYEQARRDYHADLPLANTPTIQTSGTPANATRRTSIGCRCST